MGRHNFIIFVHNIIPWPHARSYFTLFPQKKTRVRIWLYEDTKTQLEGQIIGFDEYMNMVLDEAVEIGKKRVEVGRILVKGDSITLLQEAQPPPKAQPVEEES
jgi:small nuclear ribonucleoprotein E